MESRLELQYILEEILGSRNVYYQPPASLKIKYPAIIYNRIRIESKHADNYIYIKDNAYEIIVINPRLDNSIIDKLLTLKNCKYDRHYESDNLNHDVLTLYYK